MRYMSKKTLLGYLFIGMLLNGDLPLANGRKCKILPALSYWIIHGT